MNNDEIIPIENGDPGALFARGEVRKLDEWTKGAAFGYVAGMLTPFLVYWVITGPLG